MEGQRSRVGNTEMRTHLCFSAGFFFVCVFKGFKMEHILGLLLNQQEFEGRRLNVQLPFSLL